ncbi:aminopeptidase [Sinanaerobacter sp. ZZT-01]|uniref:aminopeptidase n=1 Tax=Sinanaerobacter sp. ZZT-01 TaxID=3111540 RepID=UPI002D791D10|nr:aminopeptidase [Sinanaerobacter sp. ZZT-01]WRR92061.1 aminopeptidase [Sinanaerobacter sp. ZZT-01]
MLKFELQHAADKLIFEIFAVKKGETVVVTADTMSDSDLLDAVSASVYKAGGFPMVIMIATPASVGKAADPDIPVEALTGALMGADVWIEFNHQWLLYSTPFERAMAGNPKLRYMCLVDFSKELLVRTVGNVETPQLQVFMNRVKELHEAGKQMRVTTPAGTDVTFELDPNHVVASDCGDASAPGMHMLTGQLNVVPKFGTVNGKIVFDGTVTPPFGKVPSQPIELTIKRGKIVKFEGGSEAAEYEKYLNSFNDEGMFKMAHIAYGFNPGAKLTGNVVEDERVWGCTEWGIGYVSPMDAPPIGQDAKSHTDGICLNSTVYLDDNLIMKEGKIVDDELRELSPIK